MVYPHHQEQKVNLYYLAVNFQAPPQGVSETACPHSVPWCMFMYEHESEQVGPGE